MDDREERRQRRQRWPIVRTSLAELDEGSLIGGTPEERLAIMGRLALDAWTWMPGGIPTYSRAETPGRVLRGKASSR